MQNQLQKTDQTPDIMAALQEAPESLMLNEEQVKAAVAACNELIEEIDRDGMNEELDEFANKIQIRLKEVLGEIKDRRMPLTRALDQIKKTFTEMEAQIDPDRPQSSYGEIQRRRNAFATLQMELQKKRDEEIRLKNLKDQERIRVTGEAELSLRNQFLDHMRMAKECLQAKFDDVTLEIFANTWDEIANFSSEYTDADFAAMTLTIRTVYLGTEDKVEIGKQARLGKKELWTAEYKSAIESLKVELLDQMPGKKQHLEAQAAAEEAARKAKEEADKAAAAAKAAQDEEAKVKAAEQQRLAKEAADKAKAEQERLAKEAADKAEEARIRAAEEQDRLAKEAAEKAAAEAEVKKAQSLFDNQADVLSNAPKTKTVEDWEIHVKNRNGWLAIVSHYFTYKPADKNADPMEMGKITLDQMKRFAETDYKKEDRKIDSPMVEYKPTYKVQARK